MLLEISANTKFKIQLCKYTYVNKLRKDPPRANFSRGAEGIYAFWQAAGALRVWPR